MRYSIVDSNKLEHGCRRIYAGVHSFFEIWVREKPCSNFLASAVSFQANARWENLKLPWFVI